MSDIGGVQHQLGRVEKMAYPHMRDRRGSHQILALVFVDQQGGETIKSIHRAGTPSPFDKDASFFLRHAARFE